MNIAPDVVIDFWFSDRIKAYWFSSTPEIDQEIRGKYQVLWEKAASGGLKEWMDNSEGCLALVIILDQFPLNMFRGQAVSFKTEKQAIEIARHAVRKNLDQNLDKAKRAFLYIPFMHSENLEDQELSVNLFKENELVENIEFAKHHRGIVRRFGRFPHRNAILGRESSKEELAYLASAQAFKG